MKILSNLRKNCFYSVILTFLFSPLTMVAQVEFQWAKATHGSGMSFLYSNEMETDTAGNIFVLGSFSGSIDFDPGEEVNSLVSLGEGDIFLTKSDTNGNLIWALSFGGQQDDFGTSLSIDQDGNQYLTGHFMDTMDVDPGPGEYKLGSAGGPDIFIVKLDYEGNLIWAKQIGGTSSDGATAIEVGSSGYLYMAGHFNGTVDFDPGPGTDVHTAQNSDVFICKYDTAGNFLWVKCIEGPGSSYATALTVDADGNTHLGGGFSGVSDFDPGEGVFNLGDIGYGDNFIVNLDPDGVFLRAACYGGVSDNFLRSSQIDAEGSILLSGSFNYQTDFDPGPGVHMINTIGFVDAYILKLDSEYNFVWVYTFGGADLDECYSVTTDENNDIYGSGSYWYSVDFDAGSGEYILQSAGNDDGYILKLNSSGEFLWANSIGGVDGDGSADLVPGKNGNIYQLGFFRETVDFDPGTGIFNLECFGQREMFMRKLSLESPNNTQTLSINIMPVFYPNPARDIINIKVSESSVIRLFDSMGCVVFQSFAEKGICRLNPGNLVPGIYTLQINSASGFIADKVIIQGY